MPLIRYTCECGESIKKFYKAGAIAPAFLVCQCSLNMKKTLSGPSAESKTVIDNGVQARKIEVNIEAIKDGQNKARFVKKMRENP